MQSEWAGGKESRSSKKSRSYTGDHTWNNRLKMFA